MVQVAWAALGLLAVAVFGMFGVFFYLGARIDGVSESLGSRVDALSSRVNSLSDRLDALSARVDALGERLDARMDSLAALLQAHIECHPS